MPARLPSWFRRPAGTWEFAFRSWLAMALALYAGFLFELKGASSAAITVLIPAQPSQGMALSKALDRLRGRHRDDERLPVLVERHALMRPTP